MVPHPRFSSFQAAVLRATFVTWRGDVYRFVRPRHAAGPRLVDGLGAYKNGGRWNHLGVCRAVYCSLTPATAAREAESHCDRERIPYAKTLPRVMKAIGVDLRHVISLTDPIQMGFFGVGVADVTDLYDWQAAQNRGEEALTQSIGRAAFEAGMDGLLVPSAADPSGANLVVFTDNLPASRRMIVHRSGAHR